MEGSWAYPKSKIETEEVIHKTRGKIPAVTLRIAGVYDDLCHSIPIANNIQRIYEKQLVSHFFPGNLKAGASFVHMEDVVDAIVQCIRLRETLPKETAILIAEEDRLSTDALQRKISKLLFGKEMKTYRIPKVLAWIGAHFQRSFIKPWMVWLADDNYDIHIAKAKKLLQWEPKHRLEQSLQQMIQALKKDPKGWYKTNGLK